MPPIFQQVMDFIGPQKWRELGRDLSGLAADFWKDGPWPWKQAANSSMAPAAPINAEVLSELTPQQNYANAQAVSEPVETQSLWHAQPGEISEKMWGDGHVNPADEYVAERLIRPLGLTKDMSLLDLSAGLGGRVRKVVEEFGVYITGYEPDPEIAARGMQLSIAAGMSKHAAIAAYDPANLTVSRSYDCVIMRETIYRMKDKLRFAASIAGCTKKKAQLSFTDYIINPEHRDQPAIQAYCAHEKNIAPLGVVEMAELWAKVGFNIRVSDDQTDYYTKEVMRGLHRFSRLLASSVKPDEETRISIEKRVERWAYRMAAFEQGMRFYRFYGLK